MTQTGSILIIVSGFRTMFPDGIQVDTYTYTYIEYRNVETRFQRTIINTILGLIYRKKKYRCQMRPTFYKQRQFFKD